MEEIKCQTFKVQVATAIAVLLFVISTTAFFVIRFRDIEAKSILSIERNTECEYRISELEKGKIESDKNYVEIRTKLVNIEQILIDIKNRR